MWKLHDWDEIEGERWCLTKKGSYIHTQCSDDEIDF